MLPQNTLVRVIADPSRCGQTTGRTKERSGNTLIQVRMTDGQSSFFREDEIQPVPEYESPEELIAQGKFGRTADLRKSLTFYRLSGRVANLIYSMDTTRTDFFAYQFKPVLKFLNSPNDSLLIADEVGLGKTIEAGLIWTELRARDDARRLLVVCPAVLREKWQVELANKFGIDAKIVDAKDLLRHLKRSSEEGQNPEFALIASIQGLRPPRGWDGDGEDQSNTEKLATFLSNYSGTNLLDLLIIDEAHYLRNTDTCTSTLGALLRGISPSLLLLSATPVHLKNADLFNLLQLIDRGEFNNPHEFDAILEANEPLLDAKEILLRPVTKQEDFIACLEKAQLHPLLESNRQLAELKDSLLRGQRSFTVDYRAELASRLQEMNLLSNVVTRTRKREIVEWRVLRQPIAEAFNLADIEREFYKRVTELVRTHCAQRNAHEGFLLITPQRQMASSIPAALRRWTARQERSAVEETIEFDDEENCKPSSLIDDILEVVSDLGGYSEFRAVDTKFNRLKEILAQKLQQEPTAKIVLFSFFRDTLKYLHERLSECGISSEVMMGAGGDSDGFHVAENKNDIVKRFQSQEGPSVLLSSEVGSEGIDLQFSNIIINYDLPWNPMKVEQRIGRLDRLGQNAPEIFIWNLFAADTIDARIYKKLYERLGIFKRALGGLEEILGDKFRELTFDLLSKPFTPDEENERIDQAAFACVKKQSEEENLEKESSRLVAHGDYILQAVSSARELHRTIKDSDLFAYVNDFFAAHYPGSSLREVNCHQLLYDVTLSPQACVDLEHYLRSKKIAAHSRLALQGGGPVRCRFQNKVNALNSKGEEILSQFHPLIRFITDVLARDSAPRHCAVASELPELHLPDIQKDVYAFSVVRWAVHGVKEDERLFFSARSLSSGMPLDDDQAEKLISAAAANGKDWAAAPFSENCSLASDVVGDLIDYSKDRYEEFYNEIEARNLDRADIQERSLSRQFEIERAKLEDVKAKHIQNGKDSLAKATEGRINKLTERTNAKLIQIDERRDLKRWPVDTVSYGLIRVGGN